MEVHNARLKMQVEEYEAAHQLGLPAWPKFSSYF
jgi:hypothetical protein